MQSPNNQAAPFGDAPEFSVVVACYHEGLGLREFYERLDKTMEATGSTFEAILVNDGSEDRTFEEMERLFDEYPHIAAIIDFFKNYGIPSALAAGIIQARGAKVIMLDSDLQLDPEELPLLINEFHRGYDFVNGRRKMRRDGILRLCASFLLNRMMRALTRKPLRDMGCNYRIIDARILRAFDYSPRNVFHLAYVIAHARRYSEVKVTHHPRRFGRSNSSLWQMATLLSDNTWGFIRRPFLVLQMAIFLGLLVFLALCVVRFNRVSLAGPDITWAALVLNSILTFGILAIVGEFASRSFHLLSGRPNYIIRELRQRQNTRADKDDGAARSHTRKVVETTPR